MNFIKKRIICHKVNKALNIHLYRWQIKFIFDKDPKYSDEEKLLLTSRRTGRTLAHILKMCLNSKGDPMRIKLHLGLGSEKERSILMSFAGEDASNNGRLCYFVSSAYIVYTKLLLQHIPVRLIKFY